MSFKAQLANAGIAAVDWSGVDRGIDVTRLYIGGAPVGGMPSRGRIWYVDGVNGDDAHLGISPDTAFATLSQALTKVGNGTGDLIWVAPGVIDEAAQVVIEPEMAGVTICDTSHGGTHASRADATLESPPVLCSTTFTTAPILKIEAPCTIIGLAFSGAFVTGASVEIEYDSAGTELGVCVHLIDCLFIPTYGALHGALLTGAHDITFTRCAFIGHAVTGAGCYLIDGTTDACTCIHWEDCDFWLNVYGIELAAGDAPVGLFAEGCSFKGNSGFPLDLNGVNPDLNIDNCSFDVADEDATFEVAYAPGVGHTNMTMLDNQNFLLA